MVGSLLVVYADVLWLIDFSMDLLSLSLAGRMLDRPVQARRICAAAALGGIWSVVALITNLSGLRGLCLDLLVAGGMVALTFGKSSFPRFLMTVGSFFLVSLLLGGTMTALSNLFRGLHDSASDGSGGFLFLALAGSGITFLCTRLRRRAVVPRASVTVRMDARELTLEALVDSGNLLRDPVSGRGVIFVAPDRLSLLLNEELCAALLAQSLAALSDLPPEQRRRICLLPGTETVEGRGMRIALRPDSVRVEGEEISALLCPCAGRPEGGYEAVIPASFLTEDFSIPIHIGKKR